VVQVENASNTASRHDQGTVQKLDETEQNAQRMRKITVEERMI